MGDFYIMARSSCCTAAGDGGKLSNAKYGRQNFVRWALACLDKQSPDVFSGVKYRDVESLLPDEKEYVSRHLKFWRSTADLRPGDR